MSNTCFHCSKKITGTRFRGVQCIGSCKKYFHLKCINIAGNLDESLESGLIIWACPSCKINNQTTIDVGNASSIKHTNTPNGGTSSSTIDDVQVSINNLCSRFDGVENSQRFISDAMDALRNDLKIALEEVKILKLHIKRTDDECTSLRHRVNLLESLNDSVVQQKLASNIVITGIPLNKHDNKEVILKVLSFVQPEISSNDVLDARKVDTTKSKTKTPTEIYIVKLTSVEIKTGILNKMKNFKNFSTDDLGIQFTNHVRKRISIMHHLSPLQSKLYKAANVIKRENNFRFLWIRNGIIMLRQNPTSQVLYIRSHNNIDQIKTTLQNTN